MRAAHKRFLLAGLSLLPGCDLGAGPSSDPASSEPLVVRSALTATYDSTFRTPRCVGTVAVCDSGTLLKGRAQLGPELNAPNTLATSACADGTAGAYRSDESIEALSIQTLDGSALSPNKTARITAQVYVYSSSSDWLDLYSTASASNPSWTFLGTLRPVGSGMQSLSFDYTLPAGTTQAIRGVFRYNGSAMPCGSGAYDDRDDLVFDTVAPVDSSPPTTSLTSPAAGALVEGTVTLSATASDDVGVSRVEFVVDGGVIATSTTAPYTVSWNTRGLANGPHTLLARAYDASGKQGSSQQVTVSVDNDVIAPAVALTSPAEGAVVSGTVTLQASATDDRGVARVDFYVGTRLLASDTTAPYEAAWSTESDHNGALELSAKAYDTAGNGASSAPVHVTVATPGLAAYSEALGAPACTSVGPGCSSGGLLRERGAAEQHTPNTLSSSRCSDVGSSAGGATLRLDSLRIVSKGTLEAGKRVAIEVTGWSTVSGAQLDIYYAEDATSPYWVRLLTMSPPYPSNTSFTLAPTYKLPAGRLQAVRGVLRSGGSAVLCNNTAVEVDHDDLVFAVGSAPDTTPPTVRITSPGAGAVLSGSQVIKALASDDYEMGYLVFYIDGTFLDGQQSGDELTWDTRTVTNGSHTLTVVAYDKAGLSSTSEPVQVTVDNDFVPPTVALTSPQEGATLSGSALLTASASDDRQVRSVRFFLGTSEVGGSGTAPYRTTFNTRLVQNGRYTLTARASDGVNVTTSSAVQVWINNDLTPPTVSLTSPTQGSTVSGTVTLQAAATDNVGIAVVEFYRGTTLLGSDTTAPYTYAWQTLSEPNGTASLSVKARDTSGNEATTSAVSVTVYNGGVASYEPYYKVPRCGYAGSVCDSGNLLVGRGTLGPEANRPNTLYGSCTDGTAGNFHQSESIDKLVISSVDGGPITMGKAIRIEATVWASSQYYQDRLELYFDRYPNSTGRSWTSIATLSASGPGAQTLSTTYTLPAATTSSSSDLVIRAQFSPVTITEGVCNSSVERDVDDLAFMARGY